NSDNNHIFLKLFPFEMIHLSTLTLVFLHFTINQELWGTLQQNPFNGSSQAFFESDNPRIQLYLQQLL
ncbi:MAG: hypothetical protein WBP35_09195, partial [Lactococcus chungangensis]